MTPADLDDVEAMTCTYLGDLEEPCGADGTLFAVGPGRFLAGAVDADTGAPVMHLESSGADDIVCPTHLAAVMIDAQGRDLDDVERVMVVAVIAEAIR